MDQSLVYHNADVFILVPNSVKIDVDSFSKERRGVFHSCVLEKGLFSDT